LNTLKKYHWKKIKDIEDIIRIKELSYIYQQLHYNFLQHQKLIDKINCEKNIIITENLKNLYIMLRNYHQYINDTTYSIDFNNHKDILKFDNDFQMKKFIINPFLKYDYFNKHLSDSNMYIYQDNHILYIDLIDGYKFSWIIKKITNEEIDINYNPWNWDGDKWEIISVNCKNYHKHETINYTFKIQRLVVNEIIIEECKSYLRIKISLGETDKHKIFINSI
jgi:hypothetical protein